MTRSAISPRLATRTRRIEVTSPASDLGSQFERIEGFAKPADAADGPRVERSHRRGPRFVLIDRQSQRREHEVLRRDAVALRFASGHPDEGPLIPFDGGALLGCALEPHAGADGAGLAER